MRVKAKMNIILDGKKYLQGEEFEVSKDEYSRIEKLVEKVKDTFEEKVVNPEEKLEKKAVKKGKKKNK